MNLNLGMALNRGTINISQSPGPPPSPYSNPEYFGVFANAISTYYPTGIHNNLPTLSIVKIPPTISGIGIDTIGSGVFDQVKTIKLVYIPDGVTTINNYSFRGCLLLLIIHIPLSILMIQEQSFMDCYKLNNIVIPSNSVRIGSEAFLNCKSLSVISWNTNQISLILYSTFAYTAILQFEINPTIIGIGENAFLNCKYLTSITIPNTVYGIGGSAFKNCINLKSVSLSWNLLDIKYNTFESCSFTLIYIPNHINYMGDNAFYGVPLDTVHIGADVQVEGYETMGTNYGFGLEYYNDNRVAGLYKYNAGWKLENIDPPWNLTSSLVSSDYAKLEWTFGIYSPEYFYIQASVVWPFLVSEEYTVSGELRGYDYTPGVVLGFVYWRMYAKMDSSLHNITSSWTDIYSFYVQKI